MAATAVKILALFGPTGSGKTRLALKLAERIDGAIINADSLQLYRDLRLLSARPSLQEEARIPHYLYGFSAANDIWSAGRWREAAKKAVRHAHRAGRHVILVGGSGLYVEALLYGLSPIPPVPAAIRTYLSTWSTARLIEKLAQCDPQALNYVRPHDRQRLIRALEVLEATGRPISSWWAEPRQGALQGLCPLVCDPPRSLLKKAIEMRLRMMVAAGVLNEVSKVRNMQIHPSMPIAKAIGLQEFSNFLDGTISLETAIMQAYKSSCRYAKRQVTWGRRRLSEANRIDWMGNNQSLDMTIDTILKCSSFFSPIVD